MRLKELKSGFAIIEYNAYHKYFQNTFVFRLLNDLDEAKYNADSLYRCDHVNYAVYDCKNKKLIY